MSNHTNAEARAERVLSRYLEQGPNRSLRKLITEWRQDEDGPAPSWRTVSRWSAEYKWVDRAAQHDAEVEERAREEAQEAEVGLRAERRKLRLEDQQLARSIARDALYDRDTGSPRHLAHFVGTGQAPTALISPKAFEVAIAALRAVAAEERLDLPEPERDDLDATAKWERDVVPFVRAANERAAREREERFRQGNAALVN